MMFEKGKVLIIGEDRSLSAGSRLALESVGFRVATVSAGEKALERVQHESFDAALIHATVPEDSAMETLEGLKQASPNTAVIIISENPTISSAIKFTKLGAYDYLPVPFTPSVLLELVERASSTARRNLENACIGQELERQMLSQVLIGRSEAMNRVIRLVQKAAPVDSTVLITGETGVGKEVVARAIHRLSRRSRKPFVTVDCGTLVESLFESELFGHVKGAFSGAVENTVGKIELADEGTLFLDEIANITINMQARLLRVVQEREISRVGSSTRKNVNVRIISATNRDLHQAVREGRFREDLFYRLNVIHVPVPPLRERLEDIPALIAYYLKKLATEKGRPVTTLSDEAMRFLKKCDWPGNVRELINALEYALVTCEGERIDLKDLPHGLSNSSETETAIGGSLAKIEQNEILNALNRFQGNKTKAAEYLGINRKTLREKVQKYNLSPGKSK